MDQKIKAIIGVWESPYRPPLTEEDAREITQNLVGFFGVLEQWRQQDLLLESDPSSITRREIKWNQPTAPTGHVPCPTAITP